jgi:DNA end-binding protein Ku
MYFADEVRDPKKELDRVPGTSKAKPAELSMAAQLIDSMSGPWKPEEYRDTYTDRVNELIEAKKAGREVTVAEEAPEPTNVTDLLEVLRRSVEAAKSRQAAPAKKTAKKTTAKKATATKATPAKKTAAKKTTANKTTATKTTAKKTTAKKATAKKTTAKKTTTARKRAS